MGNFLALVLGLLLVFIGVFLGALIGPLGGLLVGWCVAQVGFVAEPVSVGLTALTGHPVYPNTLPGIGAALGWVGGFFAHLGFRRGCGYCDYAGRRDD